MTQKPAKGKKSQPAKSSKKPKKVTPTKPN
jgi:hypothetical protein